MQITDKEIQTFRERAKTELQSNGAVGRLAWDSVVNSLCNEVEELRKNAAISNAVDSAWAGVCAACAEGKPPACCAYYGEPNGCNAPTLGKHPEGDLAERLQEALEKAERRIAELERAPGNFAAKWLYRLEYHDGTCGLWYDGSGNWCFERGIGSLDDSCKTKSLPMDYDERYRQDGRSWFSSCSRKEDLLHWYSREDAKRLLLHGFVFTRYLATEYREYDQQTVFIKETCLYREEIDFESLWKSSSPGNAAALREALEHVLQFDATDEAAEDDGLTDAERIAEYADHIEECQKKARAALAAPARNCDVGTAEEQAERFRKACKSWSNADDRDYCSCECPIDGNGDCHERFGQMPFDQAEGGAK